MDPFTGLPYNCGVAVQVNTSSSSSSVWKCAPPSPVRKTQWKVGSDTSSEASDLSSMISSLYSYETVSSLESEVSCESKTSTAQSESSHTSSSSGSSDSSGKNSICSLTSSSAASSTNQSETNLPGITLEDVEGCNDPFHDIPHDTMVQWLHKISHEGVQMFADTFQHSMASDPNAAVNIAAALLRYQQQAVIEVPETMYDMVDATMRMYTKAEEQRESLNEQLKIATHTFERKLKECEDRESAGDGSLKTTGIHVETQPRLPCPTLVSASCSGKCTPTPTRMTSFLRGFWTFLSLCLLNTVKRGKRTTRPIEIEKKISFFFRSELSPCPMGL